MTGAYRWGREMATLDPDAVDKLIDLLTLPVGGEDDQRPSGHDDVIRRVSESMGLLVFEDVDWYRSLRPQDVHDVLEPWFDDGAAAELVTRAVESAPSQEWQEFLGWCERLVTGWAERESAPVGTANPRYAVDKVHGTQFYRYADGAYLYAPAADSPAAEWKSQEEWYEAAWQATAAPAPTGMVMGYPNGSSVLAGTAFYRQREDGVYLYAPTQFAAADAWLPYDHWADLAYEQAAERALLAEMTSYVDALASVLRK